MNLPNNESHNTTQWVLKNKKIVTGKSILGEQVQTFVANYECSHCFKTYTKFVGETKFNNLEIEEDIWEGGWVR